MPSMSLKHKLKLFSNYIYAGRWKEIYNILFWIYPFWWNHFLSAFLLNKLLPKTGIDLFPIFLEVEHTTVCNFRCKICVPTDTTILCSEPKMIQTVDTKDYIFNKKGKIQKVLKKYKRNYRGNLIEVKAEGILPFSLTPEHRVLVSKRKWKERPKKDRKYIYSNKFEFIEAKNLNRDYALIFPKLKESSKIKEIGGLKPSKELLRFLGLYLAEGSATTTLRKKNGKVIGRHGIVHLYFGKHEQKLINETCELIKEVFDKKAHISERRTASVIIFHSIKIANWLNQFGKKATEKKIPDFIMNLDDKELVRSFMKGFIDGDGYTNPKYIQLTTSSRGLALQLQKLLSKLNIFGRLYVNKREGESIIEGRKIKINNLYNIRITAPDFYKYLNIENISKRKIRFYEETNDYFLLPIKLISKKKYFGEVYNLETKDKTFEINNIVIHNCEHSYWKEPSINMDFKQFKYIFDQFKKPKWIGLTGIGSSYLNPDFHKIVSYCKSKGAIVELMDHFAHFKNDEQIKELLEIGPDFQFVSIYGATKKTSDEICVGSDFNKVIKNIKTFVRLKKEMKKRFPILCFHYIVTSKSKNEVLHFLDFVHSLDTEIGEVLVTPMLHDFKEAKGYSVKMETEYIEKIRKKAEELGIATTINLCAQEESKKMARKPLFTYCKEYIMPFVFVTGHISPCCGLNEANQREILKKNSPGNLFEKNLKEIWYSEKYKNIRQMIREDKCPKECALCPAYKDTKGNPKN